MNAPGPRRRQAAPTPPRVLGPGCAAHGVCASRLVCALMLLALSIGCATPGLNAARENFYLHKLDRAAANLTPLPPGETDRVLMLMERGMIQQQRRQYTASIEDWQAAVDLARALDYYSVSRGGASWIVNDRVQAFRGLPYERTLIHAFAAKSYAALGLWDDAAVEARNIVARLEHVRGFPDDPYSRTLAAACFELIGDHEGAAFQYRAADRLLPHLRVDPASGRMAPASDPAGQPAPGPTLLLFFALGRAPRYAAPPDTLPALAAAPYAEIVINGIPAGRTYALASVARLMAATEARLTALKAAKTAGRLALKELAAESLEEENEFLGELLRLALFAAEQPDTRHWETLPRWLQAARVPCPADLTAYELVVRTPGGAVLSRHTVTAPLVRRRRIFFSFYRVY
ncbi:MAG: hypothetical protein JW951_07590 [Lentisphaerae bacterium]|nr:hypothetical protein [Lentisphaerota bacterium]